MPFVRASIAELGDVLRPRAVMTTLVPRSPVLLGSLVGRTSTSVQEEQHGRERDMSTPHCCSFHAFARPRDVFDFLNVLPGQSMSSAVVNNGHPLNICTSCLLDKSRFSRIDCLDQYLAQDTGTHSPYIFVPQRCMPHVRAEHHIHHQQASVPLYDPHEFETPDERTVSFRLQDDGAVPRCNSIDRATLLSELANCDIKVVWPYQHPALQNLDCQRLLLALRKLGFEPDEYAGASAKIASVAMIQWCSEHPHVDPFSPEPLAAVDLALQYRNHGHFLRNSDILSRAVSRMKSRQYAENSAAMAPSLSPPSLMDLPAAAGSVAMAPAELDIAVNGAGPLVPNPPVPVSQAPPPPKHGLHAQAAEQKAAVQRATEQAAAAAALEAAAAAIRPEPKKRKGSSEEQGSERSRHAGHSKRKGGMGSVAKRAKPDDGGAAAGNHSEPEELARMRRPKTRNKAKADPLKEKEQKEAEVVAAAAQRVNQSDNGIKPFESTFMVKSKIHFQQADKYWGNLLNMSQGNIVEVHLLGDVVHSSVPFAGESYRVKRKGDVVPVAKAILVASPDTDSRVPSGCVLIRRVQRLMYGDQVVRIPADGFGFRSMQAGSMEYPERLLSDFTGSEDAGDGFVPLDKAEVDESVLAAADAIHAPPQTEFVVPEWWVQPADYFRQGAGFARLSHHNDLYCAKPDCALHEAEAADAIPCDACPCIFHHACLADGLPNLEPNQPWKCPVCVEREQVA